MSELRTLTALMQGLISGTFGCLDAAAETLNARWGRGASKGTLSRKLSGSLDWTLADVIALEDAAGRYPVTRMLARRLEGARTGVERSALDHAGSISKEAGEAVAAILSATQSADAGDLAQAIKEIEDVERAVREARARLDADLARGRLRSVRGGHTDAA